jgi:RNA polymerase-binding transcription factor DksA
MLLPQTISILGQQIPSITVFLAAAFVYFFFVVWYEGKKDGFDIENLFNIFFVSIILASGISFALWRYLHWSAIYAYNSPLLKIETNLFALTVFYIMLLITACLYARRLRWSYFKIADILALAVSFVVMFYALGNFFVYGGAKYVIMVLTILLLNRLILVYRSYKFSSGISFGILNTLLGLYIFFFYFVSGHLLVGVLLVTISSVLLYLRFKEGNMNTSLPADLLKHLKNKLINKENELKRQDKLLKEEDPYMQPGRAEENAEIMDEAILEDSRRELTDASRGTIASILVQVRKALAYIKMGKYGICEVCGKAIDKARLKIYPEATKCTDCASKLDQ